MKMSILCLSFALFAAEVHAVYRRVKNSEIMGGSYDVFSINASIEIQKYILFESLAHREFAKRMAGSGLQ